METVDITEASDGCMMVRVDYAGGWVETHISRDIVLDPKTNLCEVLARTVEHGMEMLSGSKKGPTK